MGQGFQPAGSSTCLMADWKKPLQNNRWGHPRRRDASRSVLILGGSRTALTPPRPSPARIPSFATVSESLPHTGNMTITRRTLKGYWSLTPLAALLRQRNTTPSPVSGREMISPTGHACSPLLRRLSSAASTRSWLTITTNPTPMLNVLYISKSSRPASL